MAGLAAGTDTTDKRFFPVIFARSSLVLYDPPCFLRKAHCAATITLAQYLLRIELGVFISFSLD